MLKTVPLYYEDPAKEAFTAEVVVVKPLRGNIYAVELDETAFYPEGGGQPSDQGVLEGSDGSLAVKIVRSQDGSVVHEGALTGSLDVGEEVSASIKWPRRVKYMRIHTAGHLIHDVLMSMANDLVAIKGRHGDKAFLQYRGEIDDAVTGALARRVNEAVEADLPVRSWESSREELEKLCSTLPSNLPQGKALRAIRIGDFEPMPDGGVHVSSTGQIGEVIVHHVTVDDGMSTIRYGVK